MLDLEELKHCVYLLKFGDVKEIFYNQKYSPLITVVFMQFFNNKTTKFNEHEKY